MRHPDKTVLEFTMLMVIVLAPLGYWIRWIVMKIAGL